MEPLLNTKLVNNTHTWANGDQAQLLFEEWMSDNLFTAFPTPLLQISNTETRISLNTCSLRMGPMPG